MSLETAEVEREISELASRAAHALPSDDPARRLARTRIGRPVDYMRCAEFSAVLRQLELEPGMRVLDVGSPQWFSLLLAHRYPRCTFHYVNVVEREVQPFGAVARACGLWNITHARQDVRSLAAADSSYNVVISISVIEHVAPAEGGDRAALDEIRRVLKPEGRVYLTVPYKSRPRVIYRDGPVYERAGGEGTFFSREYDQRTFDRLVESSGLRLQDRQYISERIGLMSLDFYQWGPGKRLPFAERVNWMKKRVERLFGTSLDPALARWYLRVSPTERFRLVNIAAVLSR